MKTVEETIIEHARNLVRKMRNGNSNWIETFDVSSVSYPFLELEKALKKYDDDKRSNNFKNNVIQVSGKYGTRYVHPSGLLVESIQSAERFGEHRARVLLLRNPVNETHWDKITVIKNV